MFVLLDIHLNHYIRLIEALLLEYNILLGTQMIAKGLDFPLVTLVGVINADTSLMIPNFRSSEYTFQLLSQVSGRSGRSDKNGIVIIQTYNPDHYAIIDSQKQDYDLFYNQEINLRKMLNYPPFCDIIVFGFSGTKEEEVINLCTFVNKVLKTNYQHTRVNCVEK